MAVSMNPFTLRSFYFCWFFWGIGLLAGLPDVQLFAQKAPRFRADVDQVVLYASVYNTEGQLVSDLKQEDFLVTENGTLQQVTYFGLDDIPATVGIVMDNSGSMRDKKDRVDKATDLFLDLNNPENELFPRGRHLTSVHKVPLPPGSMKSRALTKKRSCLIQILFLHVD